MSGTAWAKMLYDESDFEVKRMINMKQAVQAAVAFVQDFYPNAKDILLEEVGPDGSFWSVVISFKAGELDKLSEVMGGKSRLFKTVVIDADTGEPHAMKSWAA